MNTKHFLMALVISCFLGCSSSETSNKQDSTLSNEIEITQRIGRILNIESLSKPFYALRNDEFLGEEQDYLTFYKLKLIEK